MFDSPLKLIFGLAIIIIAIFPGTLDTKHRKFIASVPGRIISVTLIYYIITKFGWVYGIISAIALLLIINGVNNNSSNEGFTELIKKKANTHRWYIERVLGEKPKAIETEKVETMAVQGNINKRS
jgi:hypothetical protein